MKYVVSHDDDRGVWGRNIVSVLPHRNLKEAIEATQSMSGNPSIYRLELVGHKMKRPITKTQKKYIDYIKQFYAENGYQPTNREIAKHFHRGVSTVYMTMQKAGVNHAFYRKIKAKYIFGERCGVNTRVTRQTDL